MTKENREKDYKHLRDLENNYVALPGRDHDLEKEDVLKGRAKESADEMLKKHPELIELYSKKEKKVEEKAPEEKPDKEDSEKSKSKGKK